MRPNPGWRGDPTFLPEVLRAFGVKVVEAPSWKEIGHGDFGVIQGVFIHHIGSDRYHWSNIQNHPELGLCSQIHLSREGVATIVGAGIAWHAGRGEYKNWATNNANQFAIGIEAESNGTSPWPQVELDAYYRICAGILWFLGKRATTDTLLGHKEYSGRAQGKWDPGGIDMNDFRARVNYYIDNPPFRNEGDDDVSFDKITEHYKSRVTGSTVELTPLDALMNADAHSFVARANTEDLKARMDRIEKLVAQIAEAVV